MNGKIPSPQSGPVTTAMYRPPDPNERKRLSGPALRTFFRLIGLWKLSTAEQIGLLGFPPKSAFYRWRKAPERASLCRPALDPDLLS